MLIIWSLAEKNFYLCFSTNIVPHFGVLFNSFQIFTASMLNAIRFKKKFKNHIIFFSQVLVRPYIADTLQATRSDYVTVRVGLKTSSQDLANNTFRQELGDKLAILYKEARDSVGSSRKKRAIGSITGTVGGSYFFLDHCFCAFHLYSIKCLPQRNSNRTRKY